LGFAKGGTSEAIFLRKRKASKGIHGSLRGPVTLRQAQSACT